MQTREQFAALEPLNASSDEVTRVSAQSRQPVWCVGAVEELTQALNVQIRNQEQMANAVEVEPYLYIDREAEMAVQQNRKTRSKRGMRRAHDAIGGPR